MLITLVIIGVIAALTIPNLLQKYQEQATVKKVQKFYSNLANAYSLAKKENGSLGEWGLIENNYADNIEKVYKILFQPYFKIGKNCGPSNTGTCISNNGYKALNNSRTSNYGGTLHYYKITLDDGAAVWWGTTTVNTIHRLYVLYDTNGLNGPNQFGKDTFEFTIIENSLMPLGLKYSIAPFNTTCNDTTSAGSGCAAWVVYKGNMDYLHCDGLTWKSRSCKEK